MSGGVSDEQALALFRAVDEGSQSPDGFVETKNSACAVVRTMRYRFESGEGETIPIDVQGAGEPRYRTEMAQATAAETFTRLAGLVELVPEADWAGLLPEPAFVSERVVIGDSVMLTAAEERAGAGGCVVDPTS